MDDSFEFVAHPMDALIAEMVGRYGAQYRPQLLSERFFLTFVTVTRRIYEYLQLQYRWEAPKYSGVGNVFYFQWERLPRVVIMHILASEVHVLLRNLDDNLLSSYTLTKPSDIEYAWAFLQNDPQLPLVPASLTTQDLRSL